MMALAPGIQQLGKIRRTVNCRREKYKKEKYNLNWDKMRSMD